MQLTFIDNLTPESRTERIYMPMNYIPIIFLALATYTDVKEKKIKNNLTYTLILLGLIVSTYRTGFSGTLSSLGGIVISLAVVSLLPGFRHGGGDIKLSMGIGSFIGVSGIMQFLFCWFALSLLTCNFKLIKKQGFRNFKNILVQEILTLGEAGERMENTLGAPIMLAACLITLIVHKGGF